MPKHRLQQALYMFRHIDHAGLFLSKDRVPSRFLAVIDACCIDGVVFRAHNVRGAAATEFLRLQQKCEVKTLGRWSFEVALDKIYDCLRHAISCSDILLQVQGGVVAIATNREPGLMPSAVPRA